MNNKQVANRIFAHKIQLKSSNKKATSPESPIQEGNSSNVNQQTEHEFLNEPGSRNVSERSVSSSPISVVAPCTNETCENLRANIQSLSYQIASYNRDNAFFEQSEREKSQLKDRLVELTTYVEILTNQLIDCRDQLRKAEMEKNAARKKELEIQRHMDILETHSTNLKKKAEERDTLEKKYLNSVQILEELQAKRLQISQNLQQLVPVHKKSKTENENLKLQCERLKVDKVAAMTKITFYKKQVPAMLRLIDDLAAHTNSLPAHIRKQVNLFSDQTMRAKLIEGQMAKSQNDDVYADLTMSDDELADGIEALINGEVNAHVPVEKVPEKAKSHAKYENEADEPSTSSGMELSPQRGPIRTAKTPFMRQPATRSSKRIPSRSGRKGRQHNVDDAEKAFSNMLSSKLHNKNEIESAVKPLFAHLGVKSSIHGKKGMTVREQQAKMISVSEKVAQMKKEKSPEKKVTTAPLSPPICKSSTSQTSSSSDDEDTATHHHRRFSTPDILDSDLKLTPSPVKLSPIESSESFIKKKAQKIPEKNTIPTTPSIESVELKETILKQFSTPSTSFFSSMLDVDEINDETMDEESTIEAETPGSDQITSKRVTFGLSDNETVVDKPIYERPRTLSESSMESNPFELLEANASLSRTEEPCNFSDNIPSPSTLQSSENNPKIATPTKRALKNMIRILEEIVSPIKEIPKWTTSRYSKFHSSTEEESEDEYGELKELVIDLEKTQKEPPIQTKSTENIQQSNEKNFEPKVAKKRTISQQQKEDLFSLDILKNAHLKTQNEPKSIETHAGVNKIAETAFIDLGKKEIKEAPNKCTTPPKKTESKAKAPIRTFQNPSAQMEQAKLALSRKLKSIGNSHARKAIKREVKVQEVTEKKVKKEKLPKKQLEKTKKRVAKEIEPGLKEIVQEMPKRVTRATLIPKQVPQTAPQVIEPQAKIRQMKSISTVKASAPAKKIDFISAEMSLKKAFDLECSMQHLKRQIAADELEQIKEIPEKKYLNIMIEHVLQMKSVDMWQLVLINYKKRLTETVHNKMEENFIMMAHELSSHNFSIVLPFAKHLLMKLLSLPKIDAGLCHKMVRIILISIEALQQLGEDDENGKKIIKSLIKYFSMKRPDLLGKSMVYILNRMPQNYLSFLAEDEYQEAWKILILHSGEEIINIIDFYWQQKGGTESILPTKISVETWLSQLSISREMISNLEVNGTNINRNETLNKLFELRSICFCTPKNFEKYLLPETNALKRMLLDLAYLYKIHDNGDAVIGSIFGSYNRSLDDPGMETVLEIALQIQGLAFLFEKILESANVFKTEEFFSSIAEGTKEAYELVEFLQTRQENAPEARLILHRTLQEFLQKYSSFSELL